MNGFYPTQKVVEAAKGQWIAIMSALAPDFDPAIQRIGKHVKCPINTHSHEGNKKNFRLFKDFNETGGGCCSHEAYSNGFSLLQAHYCLDFEEAKNLVAEFLRLDLVPFKDQTQVTAQTNVAPKVTLQEIVESKPWLEQVAQEASANAAKAQENAARAMAKIKQVWSEGVSLFSGEQAAVVANRYIQTRKLAIRGLDLDNTLKAHPALKYYDEDGKFVGEFPAIISAIRDVNGRPITLHRTFLSTDGTKANVPDAKKMMEVPYGTTFSGGAIRLGKPLNGVIGISEGIETALSVYRATGFPCWSAVCAHGIESFEPTPDIQTVIIWADKDRSNRGQEAADVLARKLSNLGIAVIKMLPKVPIAPDEKSVDWNDVLIKQGLFGFPRIDALRRSVAALTQTENTEVKHASA